MNFTAKRIHHKEYSHVKWALPKQSMLRPLISTLLNTLVVDIMGNNIDKVSLIIQYIRILIVLSVYCVGMHWSLCRWTYGYVNVFSQCSHKQKRNCHSLTKINCSVVNKM